MSDLLSAAAQAMGVPEPIAERSARARAAASGQSYEDILAAWAGGQAVAAAPAEAPAETPAEAPAEQAPAEEVPAAEPAAPAAPAAPEPAAAPAPAAAVPRAPAKPPVLEAPADQPLLPIAGGLAVLILTVLLGIVFPSLPADSDEIRSSQLALSEQALEGRDVYRRAMCASCHTQAVRAVVADVGVGPVTLADTNQVVGYRRLGPDLSNVGGRLGPNQIRAVLTGGSHPATPLSQAALDALVTYLGESAYIEQGDAS